MNKQRVTRGNGLLEKFLAKKRVEKTNTLIPQNLRTGSILDIGCGSYPYFLINTPFSKKYGIDKISYSINLQNKTIEIIKYDIEEKNNLPFPNNHFNVITMLAVFEHIQPLKIQAVLKEVRRTLKPHGTFIMTTPNRWTKSLLKLLAWLGLLSSAEISEHKRLYTKEEIRKLLKQSGFRENKIQTGLFELHGNIWAIAVK